MWGRVTCCLGSLEMSLTWKAKARLVLSSPRGTSCFLLTHTGRSVTIDGKTIKAQIWDTAGQERYRAITSACVNYSLVLLSGDKLFRLIVP